MWVESWQGSSKVETQGTSLIVHWLGLCASTTAGTGLIPGQGTKIPQAGLHGQKKKRERPKILEAKVCKAGPQGTGAPRVVAEIRVKTGRGGEFQASVSSGVII